MRYSAVIKRFIAITLSSLLITVSSVPFISAEEAPNREQVTTGISQEAAVQLVNSGDNVQVETKQDQQHDQKIENANTAAVQQTTTVDANTGNNEASRNISVGGNAGVIQTGDIGVVSQAAAGGNTNVTAVDSGGGPSPTSGASGGAPTAAVTSGDNASATSESNTSNNTSVQNTNDATVNQATNVNANTGSNRADRNISIGGSAGVINTGSVGVSTYYLAVPNHNVTLIGGENGNGNGPGSGASIQLANTGDGVNASGSASNATNTSVSNNNTSYVNQLANINANTGNNTANRNISFGGDAGVIYTGNVGVGVTYVVDGNENNTAVAGGSDSSSAGGGPTTQAVNTGDKVNASSDTNNQSSTSVSNTNKTYVTQAAYINANTGNNIANRNIAYGGTAGGISTGSVGVNVTFLADFSKNTTHVHPTTAYYLPSAAGHLVTSPTPTAAPQQSYIQPESEEPVYYYYPTYDSRPIVRSPYASFASNRPAVMGAYETNPAYADRRGAQVAVQESSPSGMSLSSVSQLMVMLVSLGALGLRKIVRI